MKDTYKVLLSPKAYRDIESIYKYISSEIVEPVIAKNQIDRIWNSIATLSSFPYSHQDRLVGRFANKGYKQLLTDNYIVIYKVDENKKEVIVLTIHYGGRNI